MPAPRSPLERADLRAPDPEPERVKIRHITLAPGKGTRVRLDRPLRAALEVPELELPSTLGGAVGLAELARECLVAYVYPRTGIPEQPSPSDWDDIPGARGCTPQSCAYRDSLAEFSALGATVVGISTQSPEEQQEFAEREHIPFALLSDSGLCLAEQLRLPTFTSDEMTLYKRLTFVAEAGKIARVFYPVFPPDRNAETVLFWLTGEAK